MASRTKQKEEARARRLAAERAAAEQASRRRRMQMLVGVIVAAVAVVAVIVAISASGGNSGSSAPPPTSSTAHQQASTVDTLLAGIPQSGTTLGSPSAKVTVTEFGDLECPICRDFALGAENQLISNDVRSGKVKLVYRSLETATGGAPNPNIFPVQQAAAYAAGLQNKGWYYIDLFYHEQGQEDTGYVTQSYLNGLASQVPGLNYAKWVSDSKSSSLIAQVNADEQTASNRGFDSTPTILVVGPKGAAQPIVGAVGYGTLESTIKSVS